MSSSSRTSTVLTAAAVTVLGGLVAYAVYFDYKRRNDSDFRKKLRKEKKKVTKQTQQAQAAADAASEVSAAAIKDALLKIREEEIPPTPDEKEGYFMMQVQIGDQLVQKGPSFYLPAACAFFRALRVYPSPVEFIMMVQSTLPAPIFKIFMELVNTDVASRVEGYYDHFPPKRMNVSIHASEPEGDKPAKKILIAAKDFEAGDIIYTESPFVVALDADLEGKGTHCSYCFRRIEEGQSFVAEADKLGAVFCSTDCQTKANLDWNNMLFGREPVLPPELDPSVVGNPTDSDGREAAQTAYVKWLKAKARQPNVLGARFVAKQIAHETSKLVKGKDNALQAEAALLADGGELYSVSDHMERLRFVEGNVTDEEVKLLQAVFGAALPGLEQSVNEERLAVLVGKMAYNAIGITPDGGRDDKSVSDARPEDQERTRTPQGTQRQLGSGLYLVSSYLAHSCDPSTRPSFVVGSNELQLFATRPLKKGEELTIAYVDVAQHADESAEAARRRRRVELARGWKFKCECERCLAEAVQDVEKEDAELGVDKDGAKVEQVMRHEKLPGAGMGVD
ncbi:transcription factor [Ganoderma sinense ZZ0214-1]|uniref:Transcription factor n=1 Tax=Ganoderma sinense ZZ0214-1 TaxID=1077348 RepID=A0A2G8STQ1_9APHY|nr:transcription factor [Ganoderma sinense ZZ0214-1]